MNRLTIIGNLTRDPELRTTTTGATVCTFTVAVNRRAKSGQQPEADFFDCVAFGRQAEFAEKYLRQGIKMVVQGRLQNDNYQDREGRMVYRTQIVIENQEFAESKAASQQNAASYRAPAGAAPAFGNAQAPSFSAPAAQAGSPADDDEFMNIPSGIEEELPFE